MPIRVEIVDEATIITLPTKTVEISDKCQFCGADLTQPGAIIEVGYVYYCSHGRIQKADPEHGLSQDTLDCNGSFKENFNDVTKHVGYMCNVCNTILT